VIQKHQSCCSLLLLANSLSWNRLVCSINFC
jgi:hypothetical protein